MERSIPSHDQPAWNELRAEIVSCTRCPRLVAYRRRIAREKKRQFMGWEYWGAPLPGFGDTLAELLILGLAPAAHGGNRTGRMFTGDGSASFLMRALHAAGFCNQPTSERRDDGLQMKNAYITAVVRCPPPKNKPTATESANCSRFLDRELASLPHIRVVLALGRLAFNGYLAHAKRCGAHIPRLEFQDGRAYSVGPGFPLVVASYHPSRQNTQTGRLTMRMMKKTLATARGLLSRSG
jgi:uracil-DNA glycosylase family 4